jgi:hypothetical protein
MFTPILLLACRTRPVPISKRLSQCRCSLYGHSTQNVQLLVLKRPNYYLRHDELPSVTKKAQVTLNCGRSPYNCKRMRAFIVLFLDTVT